MFQAGILPSSSVAEELVQDACVRFKSDQQGKNSEVYPAVGKTRSRLFGICLVETPGDVHAAGEPRARDHEHIEAVYLCAGMPRNRSRSGAGKAGHRC